MVSTRQPMKFGAALRKHRVRSNLGLRQLAGLSGVSPTYLCRIEHDDLPPPSGDVITRMAIVLNIDVDTLRVAAGLMPERVERALHERPGVMRVLELAADMTDEEVRELCDTVRRRSISEVSH